MTRDWKYILYISLAFGAFIALKLLSPAQHDWTVTFGAEDKNPFGGYAMNRLVRTSFPAGQFRHSYKTLYELKDSLQEDENLFIVAETFSPSTEDTEALLGHVYKGGNAFISAHYIYGIFSDTLRLQTYDVNFKFGGVLSGADSSSLHLVASSFDSLTQYTFKQANIHHYISNFDTTRTSVIAENEQHVPVTIRMKWGEGNLIINSTPMVLTNIYMVAGNNSAFASSMLSYLPATHATWTEYYQRGRHEVATPLRFVLLTEPLRWAYYISIVSLLVFMIFEMKRRQRIIPVIPPLPNTTLEFVATIGDLYYQNGDHRNLADKKIIYFLEHVRSRYGLPTNQLDGSFAALLARKAGRDESETKELVDLINRIRSVAGISSEQLIELNSKIEEFNQDA